MAKPSIVEARIAAWFRDRGLDVAVRATQTAKLGASISVIIPIGEDNADPMARLFEVKLDDLYEFIADHIEDPDDDPEVRLGGIQPAQPG